MESCESIISNLKLLTNSELVEIQSFINRHLKNHIENIETKVNDAKSAKSINIICPNCGSNHYKKNGTSYKGRYASQRYLCKDCGRTFNAQSSTILKSTKLKFEKLERIIFCIVSKMTVKEVSEICEVSPNTAFLWRHKILDVLKQVDNETRLSGFVEADETYFPISYKGNHSDDGFEMPRAPIKHKREGEKRGISNDKICVFCAIEPKGNVVNGITNLGNPKIQHVYDAFDGRIESDTIMVTDKKSCYRQFSSKNNIQLVQVKFKRKNDVLTEKQPKLFRKYHIQHINSYHSGLKTFIKRFKGISSKYLDNYITWNNLNKHSKENTIKSKCSYIYEEIFSRDCRTVRKEMAKRPSIAFCQNRQSPIMPITSSVDVEQLATEALSLGSYN